MAPQADAIDLADTAAWETRRRRLATRSLRRGNNRIRRMHHHAVRTDDMTATRLFYEDVLGLPLVHTHLQAFDRGPDGPLPFLHCFFELGDGSCLAFFELQPGAAPPADQLPTDGIDHHIAVSVPHFGDMMRYKAAFDRFGFRNAGINHGFCYSLYVRDPNGMLVELVADAPNELDVTEDAAEQAHARLEQWVRKDYRPSPPYPVVSFPLDTSPPDAIEAVIRGVSPGPV